jgi:Na+-translocating ferredoxin:NAD+ oxidoreductase RNF subunit RnfB
MILTILEPAIMIGILGLLYGLVLAFASKKFYVEIDPRIEKITATLPGANCGACGYPGCSGYADAIVKKDIDFSLCSPGGSAVSQKIASIIGKEATEKEKQVALIHCNSGGYENTNVKYEYHGVPSCRAVSLLASGSNLCNCGCVSQNDCIRACQFGAISLNEQGMRVVDPDKCGACGACVKACPRNLIEIVPISKQVHILCSSTERGLTAKKHCGSRACIGCGLCVQNCPMEAIKLENHIAKINYIICISCGVCAKKCPTKAIIDNKPKRGKAKIIRNECIGCTICSKKCPINCISGELKKPHEIDEEKCIGCEMCVAKCPKKAIVIT